MNGRIPQGIQGALFDKNGSTQNVDSLLNMVDASGWCFYLG
jgi:hypothetical protein